MSLFKPPRLWCCVMAALYPNPNPLSSVPICAQGSERGSCQERMQVEHKTPSSRGVSDKQGVIFFFCIY